MAKAEGEYKNDIQFRYYVSNIVFHLFKLTDCASIQLHFYIQDRMLLFFRSIFFQLYVILLLYNWIHNHNEDTQIYKYVSDPLLTLLFFRA